MSRFKYRGFLYGCFITYCLLLFAILFLRGIGGHYDFSRYPYWRRIWDRTNLIPFSTIREQLDYVVHSTYNRRVAIWNLAANLLLFAPMGTFLPMLWTKLRRFGSCLRLWTGMILTIEIAQLLTLQGSFDIDDVILNTLGFFIGFCVFLLINRLTREEK